MTRFNTEVEGVVALRTAVLRFHKILTQINAGVF